MALAKVLSALRKLILDVDAIPESVDSRRTAYSRMFPALSSDEVEDLAKIPADQFKTYTTTIFHGEKGVLKNHFSATFALLGHLWPSVMAGPFDPYQLTVELHRARPWKSRETEALAKNFVNYLSIDLRNHFKEFPILFELAGFEMTSLMVKRAASRNTAGVPAYSKDDLQQFSIGDLMETRCLLPEYDRFISARFDLPAICRVLRSEENTKFDFPASVSYLVGSRNSENYLRWTEIGLGMYDRLACSAGHNDMTISTLAEAYLEDPNPSPGASEEIQLLGFLGQLFPLVENGALVVVKR